ncbi:IclR family transcriptional regulator [Arthrobacter sp. SLBN-100]|nr:IclR family transcriptional regulator [Arthrobacter sp. SLBN-100]
MMSHAEEPPQFPTGARSGKGLPSSQATERVVDILELLASQSTPVSLADVAASLGVHRSVVYRVLRTLTDRRLVHSSNGGYRLGELLLVLANAVPNDLRDVAISELTKLTAHFGVTSFVTIDDGGRSVCLQTVEPDRMSPHVTLRPGTWGPMDVGAPAIAILSGRAASAEDPDEVKAARARGYATSSGERTAGIQWVASPIAPPGQDANACLGVLFPKDTLSLDEVGKTLRASATRISKSLAVSAR